MIVVVAPFVLCDLVQLLYALLLSRHSRLLLHSIGGLLALLDEHM